MNIPITSKHPTILHLYAWDCGSSQVKRYVKEGNSSRSKQNTDISLSPLEQHIVYFACVQPLPTPLPPGSIQAMSILTINLHIMDRYTLFSFLIRCCCSVHCSQHMKVGVQSA